MKLDVGVDILTVEGIVATDTDLLFNCNNNEHLLKLSRNDEDPFDGVNDTAVEMVTELLPSDA